MSTGSSGESLHVTHCRILQGSRCMSHTAGDSRGVAARHTLQETRGESLYVTHYAGDFRGVAARHTVCRRLQGSRCTSHSVQETPGESLHVSHSAREETPGESLHVSHCRRRLQGSLCTSHTVCRRRLQETHTCLGTELNIVIISTRPEGKNDCGGEGQQKYNRPTARQ
jgi:hypothetical protein